jgi:hypothetical protein
VSAVKRASLLAALFCAVAFGHVGSPDVFFQGKAGPYELLVSIRPPEVIPGVAQVEIRSLSAEVNRIELTPTPMTGEAANHPPIADIAERSSADPQSFTGSLWLMAIGSGSWKVRVHAFGPAGEGDLQIPVPTLPTRMKPMDQGVTYFLIGMMVFLTVGMVALVGAGIRESKLEPGVPSKAWNAKTIGIMGAVSVLLLFILWSGNNWWIAEASSASERIYKPLGLTSTFTAPDRLLVQITDPGWIIPRKLDNLAPDHGHLMHLFLVRWPDMDEVFHLHRCPKATTASTPISSTTRVSPKQPWAKSPSPMSPASRSPETMQADPPPPISATATAWSCATKRSQFPLKPYRSLFSRLSARTVNLSPTSNLTWGWAATPSSSKTMAPSSPTSTPAVRCRWLPWR